MCHSKQSLGCLFTSTVHQAAKANQEEIQSKITINFNYKFYSAQPLSASDKHGHIDTHACANKRP